MSVWNISGDETSDPGSKIARRLWELDNQGCYVDIVADAISDEPNGPLRMLLAKPENMDGTSTNYHGPEGDSFCVRPDQWVDRLVLYSDNQDSWQNSVSSHRLVDPGDCDRWFGGYHEPHRPRSAG